MEQILLLPSGEILDIDFYTFNKLTNKKYYYGLNMHTLPDFYKDEIIHINDNRPCEETKRIAFLSPIFKCPICSKHVPEFGVHQGVMFINGYPSMCKYNGLNLFDFANKGIVTSTDVEHTYARQSELKSIRRRFVDNNDLEDFDIKESYRSTVGL